MPTMRVNERDIFFAGRRLDRRPTMLLVHGAGGSHLDWPAQLRRIEECGSCAIDLPGHGRSAGPARSSVAEYADDVLALARKLELPALVLAGHSMGGAIALDIALRQTIEVVALILVATGARLKVNESLLGLVESDFEAAVDHVTDAAWGPNAEPEMVRRASQLMLSCEPTSLSQDFAACNDFDVMARLGSVPVPTLVLVGTEDRLTPPKFGRYLADHIPDAEFVSVDGAGHMLAAEQPELVGDVVASFIVRRLRAGQSTDNR